LPKKKGHKKIKNSPEKVSFLLAIELFFSTPGSFRTTVFTGGGALLGFRVYMNNYITPAGTATVHT